MNTKLIFTAIIALTIAFGTDAQTLKTMNNATENANGQVIKKGKLIYSEIKINARPDKVWQILTNFNDYPQWNPFIISISGEPIIGKKIHATIQPIGSSGMKFNPKVLQFTTNKELRWIGTLGISRIFDGEHTFKLIDNGDGTTSFLQYERFRGIMVPFAKKMLEVNSLQGFEAMNAKLKELAEK